MLLDVANARQLPISALESAGGHWKRSGPREASAPTQLGAVSPEHGQSAPGPALAKEGRLN